MDILIYKPILQKKKGEKKKFINQFLKVLSVFKILRNLIFAVIDIFSARTIKSHFTSKTINQNILIK